MVLKFNGNIEQLHHATVRVNLYPTKPYGCVMKRINDGWIIHLPAHMMKGVQYYKLFFYKSNRSVSGYLLDPDSPVIRTADGCENNALTKSY